MVFDGFLIGESFMRDAYPERACREFIHQVELLSSNLAVDNIVNA